MGLNQTIVNNLKTYKMEPKNEQLLKSISGTYQMITEEMARPKEDVVGFSVCGATKRTIADVLRLYLNSKNISTQEGENANDLMKHCMGENKNFSQFDMSPLACRCEPSHDSPSYCLGHESIDTCYKLLSSIKNFVFDELKISN